MQASGQVHPSAHPHRPEALGNRCALCSSHPCHNTVLCDTLTCPHPCGPFTSLLYPHHTETHTHTHSLCPGTTEAGSVVTILTPKCKIPKRAPNFFINCENIHEQVRPEAGTPFTFSLLCPHTRNSAWHTTGSQGSVETGQTHTKD